MDQNSLFVTEDGSHSILSGQFKVSYHSKYGAIQESNHVFINAALQHKEQSKKQLNILEIGLGTALNAYLTYLYAQENHLKIQYDSIEAFPIEMDQAKALNYSKVLDADNKHIPFLKFHEVDWDTSTELSENFTFTKYQKKFEAIDYQNKYDIIYFDAFAPDAQPELWETTFLQKMYDALLPEGVLTTYCAKGVVKRTFKGIGFELETLPGPPGKREMIRVKKTLAQSQDSNYINNLQEQVENTK